MRFNSHYFFRNIFLLAALVSSLLLTACGGGGGSTPSEQTEFIYSTTANNKGTFKLTSVKSGAMLV